MGLETQVNILLNQNKVTEAELALDRLIELKPNQAHYLALSGNLAFDQGNFDKALERYQAACQTAPDNAEYAVKLANILFDQEKLPQAKALYERIIRKDPRFVFAWEQYINALNNSGHHSEALTVAQRAVKQSANNSDFYFLLATVYDTMSQKSEAVQAYRRSLELQPMPNSIAASRILELTGKRVPPKLEQMDTDHVPFETEGKVMFVEALVNDRPGRFLLDTGASTCILFHNGLNTYHLTPSALKMQAQTANGIIQAPIAFGSVQLGRHKLNNIVFAVIPAPTKMEADGIIGMDYLEKFRMEIDRPRQQITLVR